MVLPSRSEGMPNALLEAMSIGLPVIATRVGGVGEVASDGETAWLVPPESPDDLARALIACAQSPEERARRGALARDTIARTFAPEARTWRLTAMYRNVLGGAWTPAYEAHEPAFDSVDPR
jgi:glycosyltransferase involved in cell wall biosynthesis